MPKEDNPEDIDTDDEIEMALSKEKEQAKKEDEKEPDNEDQIRIIRSDVNTTSMAPVVKVFS